MKKTKKLKSTIGVAVAILLLLAAVFGLSSLFGNQTRKIGVTAFSVGGLNDAGEYIDQENTIFTKDLIECQGLEIEPDFMSTVSYRVFLYSSEKKLIEATSELIGNYKLTNTLAQYCRIMIIPEESNTKDFSISILEIPGIADDLKITVNRKQDFKLRDYFVADDTKENMVAANNEGVLGYAEKLDYGCTELIKVGSIESFTIKFSGNGQPEGAEVLFFTADESGEAYTYVSTVTLTGEENKETVTVPEGATHMVVNYSLSDNLVINQAVK